MAENRQQQEIKEITEKLEQGVKELFESEKYKAFLHTMSKFHNYSLNNTMLIAMQKPDATLVAGYTAWQHDHERHVMKGEKGIRIFAPAPYKVKVEQDKIDPVTSEPVVDENNNPVKEVVEIKKPAFKLVSVFDISQTQGKDIPTLGVDELLEDVEDYVHFFDALERSSPVPVGFETIEGGAKGYYHQTECRIALNEGMSEVQNVKTLIHEMAHQKLHAVENMDKELNLSRSAKEIEAESIAYVICQHYGIDTSEYSFAYLAAWSDGKDTPELKASLDRIRKASNEMINEIDGHIAEVTLEIDEKYSYVVTETSDAFEQGDDFAIFDKNTDSYVKDMHGDTITFSTKDDADRYLKNMIAGKEDKAEIVGVVSYASGEYFEYTDKEAYLRCIQNEIEYASTTGFRFETRSADPELRKAVDDEMYNIYGMENPHKLKYYQPKDEQAQGSITFYVAECMEYPEHGELHEGLSIKEAFDIYERIPSDRMYGIKGIGFELEDGSIYEGKYDLMRGYVVQDEMINCVTHYRNSPLVQDAIKQCREELNARMGEISDGIEAGAYVVGEKGYLSMQSATEGSWDYAFYDSDYKLIGGGQAGDGKMSFAQARNEILQSFGLMQENIRNMNPNVLAERTSMQKTVELPQYQKQFLTEMSDMGIDVDNIFVGGKKVSLSDHVMTEEEVKVVKRQIEYDNIPKMLYTADQWKEIENGMKHQLDVRVYANPEYTERQMREIRIGLDKGVDVSAFASPEFSDKQMREIRRGVEAGIDVSSYAHADISAGDMRKAFFALKDGTNALENQIKNAEPDKDSGLYRYYSTQRPVAPGTFPGKPKNIENFDSRESVCNGQMQAWGYLEYEKPLTEKQMNDYELKPAVYEAVVKEQPSFLMPEKVEKDAGKKKSVMENLRRKQAQIAKAVEKKSKTHEKEARE